MLAKSNSEVPQIIDFGLANKFEPGQLFKTPCGSPSYASPEVIRQQKYAGPSSDVWSLGVILYCECHFDVSTTCHSLRIVRMSDTPVKNVKKCQTDAFYSDVNGNYTVARQTSLRTDGEHSERFLARSTSYSKRNQKII